MSYILSHKEFRETTMGCFYQSELRAHDKALRTQLRLYQKLRRVSERLAKESPTQSAQSNFGLAWNAFYAALDALAEKAE